VSGDELMGRLVHECRRLDDEQVADLIGRLASFVRDRHLALADVTAVNVRVTVIAEHSPDWKDGTTGGETRIEIRAHDKFGALRRSDVRKPGIAPAPTLADEVQRRDAESQA
jgi:hypothetical protein